MNSINLIGLAGCAGVGKTTFASYLESKGYTKYSFASPLKKGLKEIFGFTDTQLYTEKGKETVDEVWGITPRNALQYVGTELFRKNINGLLKDIGEDFWLMSFKKLYEKNKKILYVIDDVRFINEVKLIKSLGGIVIHIVKTDTKNNSSHDSESELKKYNNFDGTIDNTGRFKTFNELDKLLNEIISKGKI